MEKNTLNTEIHIHQRYYDYLKEQFKEFNIKKSIEEILVDILLEDKILSLKDFDNIKLIKELNNRSYIGISIPKHSVFVYFTQLLTSDFKTKSRNTFVKQNALPVLKKLKENKLSSVFLCLNPVDYYRFKQDSKIKRINLPKSIINDLQLLKLLHFELSKTFLEILKDDSIKEINNFNPKITVDDFVYQKQSLKLQNKHNNPIFIELNKEDKEIKVIGKLDGANISDTVLTCMLISRLNNSYNLSFWLINSKARTKVVSWIKSLGFKYYGFYEKEKYLKNLLNQNIEVFDKDLIRKQNLLKLNIWNKYFDFIDILECFACNYNISNNLITSHIHRHSDIKKELLNNEITYNDGIRNTTSGDNGFLLCPNHDKEFEKGYIYFDLNEFKFKVNQNYQNSFTHKQWMKLESNLINKFNKKDFPILVNKNFRRNIDKHLKRINKI
ncbi:HNH endonuclease signature motif containing protein [Mycoplasmopsis felis]|uniref:HNH endonuclease signature motif containing protein n=1 Tax=Mycoplasmopsis felis TaxID=33923 RepID=UPI002B0035A9|nr:HNH endonuclease signature motif containing protein [Mycoplasmopsis felis]WQQ10834.1 HNH endonuclease signature motif containing protein [Mycoplasmopsis felis]